MNVKYLLHCNRHLCHSFFHIPITYGRPCKCIYINVRVARFFTQNFGTNLLECQDSNLRLMSTKIKDIYLTLTHFKTNKPFLGFWEWGVFILNWQFPPKKTDCDCDFLSRRKMVLRVWHLKAVLIFWSFVGWKKWMEGLVDLLLISFQVLHHITTLRLQDSNVFREGLGTIGTKKKGWGYLKMAYGPWCCTESIAKKENAMNTLIQRSSVIAGIWR